MAENFSLSKYFKEQYLKESLEMDGIPGTVTIGGGSSGIRIPTNQGDYIYYVTDDEYDAFINSGGNVQKSMASAFLKSGKAEPYTPIYSPMASLGGGKGYHIDEARDMTFNDYLDILDERYIDIARAVKGENGSDNQILPTRGDILNNITMFRNYVTALKRKYKDDKTKLRFITERLIKNKASYASGYDVKSINEAKSETGINMVKKKLDALGVKYEMSKTDKVRPFKVIYKPINKSDQFYDKFEDIVDLFNLKDVVKSINEASRTRISVPRFVKDKNNPNFLNVYIDYDLGPGGSSIALGKETMTGQIRRESAAEAMKLAGDVARDLKAKYNLEDIEISDLENGKVRVFAVSDDFTKIASPSLDEAKSNPEVDSTFNTNKVWAFIESKPFYNKEYMPKFSTAEEIWSEFGPEDKEKYANFAWTDTYGDNIHPREKSALQRKANYDKLAGVKEIDANDPILMQTRANTYQKSGKTINTKKEALLALDYIEPTIKEENRDEFGNEYSTKNKSINESEDTWNAIDVSRKAEKEISNSEWNSRTTKKLDILKALNKAGKFKKEWDNETLQGWVDQNYSWEKLSRQFKNLKENNLYHNDTLEEGTCGYTLDGKKRNKPAGPDLIKLKEKILKQLKN
jgi:hypothetical protein